MARFLLTIALTSLIGLPVNVANAIDAVWKEQDVDFTFISLETAYSCDEIEGKIEVLLRHVGATEIDVTVPSCGGFKYPQRQLRILARFSALVPAGEGDVDIVQAAWSEVELGKWHPRSIDDPDCEVLEQFQKYLLSTIEHDVIEGTTGCGAIKHTISGRLKLKVLKPVAEIARAKNEE